LGEAQTKLDETLYDTSRLESMLNRARSELEKLERTKDMVQLQYLKERQDYIAKVLKTPAKYQNPELLQLELEGSKLEALVLQLKHNIASDYLLTGPIPTYEGMVTPAPPRDVNTATETGTCGTATERQEKEVNYNKGERVGGVSPDKNDNAAESIYREQEIDEKECVIKEFKEKIKSLEEKIESAADAEDYALAATLDAEMLDVLKRAAELERELAALKT